RHGLDLRPNLTELAGRGRGGLRPHDAWDHAQTLPGGLAVVLAHPSADQIQAVLRASAARLGGHLAPLHHADGLLHPRHLFAARPLPPSPLALPLLGAAALVLVVVRPRLAQLTALAHQLPALRELAAVELLLVGSRPYGPAEVARVLEVPVAGALADDPRAAA